MDFIDDIYQWFSDKLEAFTDVLWSMFKDFLFWLVEIFLGFATSTIDLIFETVDWFNPMQYISFLPDNIHNVLVLIGFGEMISILFSAILIRVTMNLVPSFFGVKI